MFKASARRGIIPESDSACPGFPAWHSRIIQLPNPQRNMSTNYDHIAEQYRRSKQIAWREHIEQYTLFSLLGDMSGLTVLDLACGEGHYSRMLKAKGAAKVVGVDLSKGMIELANDAEKEQPLGITYMVADARDVASLGCFDVVLASYLLNYARSEAELLDMSLAIARSLKPGGRFVGINNNPAQHISNFAVTEKYGFIKSAEGEITSGSVIRYTFIQGDERFAIENYHLDPAVHLSALSAAGLKDVRWHSPELCPAEASSDNAGIWNDFLEDPPIAFLSAKAPQISRT